MKEKKKSVLIITVSVLIAAVTGTIVYYASSCFFTAEPASSGGYTYRQVKEISMPYAGSGSYVKSCYGYLESDKLRNLYSAIEETVFCIASESDSGKYNTIPVYAGEEEFSEKEIHMTVTAFFDDNPQIFWCDKSLLYSYSKKNGAFVSAVSLYSADEVDKMNEKLADAVLKAVSDAPASSDLYYVEKYIHDRITGRCVYKTPDSASSLASTAYGCLVENRANCEGITDGFNLLMKCFGAETLKIYGSAQGIGLHTWNCVKLNNSWYMTDVTWDMRSKGHSYDYFNMTEKEFSKTHTVETTYSEIETDGSLELSVRYYNIYVPECNDLNQSFFAREGYSVTKKEDIYRSSRLLDYIFRAFKSGSGWSCLKISTDKISIEEVTDILFEDENLEFYNSNMQYRLSEGETFHTDGENAEVSEDLGIVILRF